MRLFRTWFRRYQILSQMRVKCVSRIHHQVDIPNHPLGSSPTKSQKKKTFQVGSLQSPFSIPPCFILFFVLFPFFFKTKKSITLCKSQYTAIQIVTEIFNHGDLAWVWILVAFCSVFHPITLVHFILSLCFVLLKFSPVFCVVILPQNCSGEVCSVTILCRVPRLSPGATAGIQLWWNVWTSTLTEVGFLRLWVSQLLVAFPWPLFYAITIWSWTTFLRKRLYR